MSSGVKISIFGKIKHALHKILGRSAALDLTIGKPLKKILIFMIPLLIGNIFQQLYSMVDTIIVGKTLGSAALTGVGSTGAISFLIMGFVQGLTHGFSVVTSQRRGAKDDEGMRKSFATGILLTAVIISVLTVVAVFVTEPLLRLMNTQEEFFPYARDYILTIFGGMLLSAFYNQFSSTLRAIGDSVVPLLFLILASVLNACLDILFILVFGMGVRGAAAATLVSQGVSAVLTFIYMWVRYPVLRFKLRHFVPNMRQYVLHLRLGLPMALQFSVISIGMIFSQTALNTMEPIAVTAYVAASKVDGIACSIINSTGAAAATYVGQNYGAKQYRRIKKGVGDLLILSFAASIALGVLVIGLYKPLTMMFLDKAAQSQELFSYALQYLAFNGGFYVLLACLVVCRSAIQGMGRGAVTLIAAAAEVAMRVGMAILAMNLQEYMIVCMCNCAAWLGSDIILLPSFLMILKKYVRLGKTRAKHIRMPNPSTVPMMAAIAAANAKAKNQPKIIKKLKSRFAVKHAVTESENVTSNAGAFKPR